MKIDGRSFSEVVGLNTGSSPVHGLRSRVTGVRVRDYRSGEEFDLKADLVINACGAWSQKVVGFADIDIAVNISIIGKGSRTRFHINLVAGRIFNDKE